MRLCDVAGLRSCGFPCSRTAHWPPALPRSPMQPARACAGLPASAQAPLCGGQGGRSGPSCSGVLFQHCQAQQCLPDGKVRKALVGRMQRLDRARVGHGQCSARPADLQGSLRNAPAGLSQSSCDSHQPRQACCNALNQQTAAAAEGERAQTDTDFDARVAALRKAKGQMPSGESRRKDAAPAKKGALLTSRVCSGLLLWGQDPPAEGLQQAHAWSLHKRPGLGFLALL